MCFRDFEEFGGFCKKVGKLLLIFSPFPFFGVGFCIADHKFNTSTINQAIKKIEEKIEKNASFVDYTYQAFTVDIEDENKYLDILGIVQENENSPLYFTKISFALDSEATIYDQIINESSITYEYIDGKIIAAKNEYNYNFINTYRRCDEAAIYCSLSKRVNTPVKKQFINEIPPEISIENNSSSTIINSLNKVNVISDDFKHSL